MWKVHFKRKDYLPCDVFYLKDNATKDEVISFFGLDKPEIECYQVTKVEHADIYGSRII